MFLVPPGLVGIDQHPGGGWDWQEAGEPSACHNRSQTCILDHESNALGRMVRREWRVAAACLEDAEHRHHKLNRPLQEDADKTARTDSQRCQVAGETIGGRIEFRERHLQALTPQRYSPRRAPRLLTKQPVQGRRRPEIDGGIVELERHAMAIGVAEQIKRVNRHIGGVCHFAQES